MRDGVVQKLLAFPLVIGELAGLLRELIRGHDLINSHWLVPSGLLASLLATSSHKHIITVHAADYDLLLTLPAGKSLIKYMAGKAHALVCVSPRLADGIAAVTGGRSKIVTQSMGVDTGLFRFDEEARAEWRGKTGAGGLPVIMFAGKLSAKKGVDVLVRAADILKRGEFAFQLVIAGDGSERTMLEALVSELGLSGQARFIGAVPNRELARIYSAADVVAVPSVRDPRGETEGMPVVILEALSAGRPVAATRLCSVPGDLVGSGVIEVMEGDPEALALALKDALSGAVEVDQKIVASYDVKAVAEKYAGIFMEGVS